MTVNLFSDTQTRPTEAMRKAMASAEVGDEQRFADPTVNQLQERVAGLLGKEAALWVPSGTMANQVALRVLTRPGDDVIVSREAHALWHETGGAAGNASVQLTEIGAGGLFTLAEFLAAIKPQGHGLYPPTTLVEIENTHNRAGGVVFPQKEARNICAAARERKIATYLDGARLWNVAAATGKSLGELTAPFDVVAVAFSKGLGAPGGSMLAGSREFIARAVRQRRMLGGAMRQIGIFAAAALYALDQGNEQLVTDHKNARRLAERLAGCKAIELDLATVQTNIIVFRVAFDSAIVVERAKAQGVLVNAFGPRTIRAVTHLDVTGEQCDRAGEVLVSICEAANRK